MTIGEKIRQRREQLGISQSELAKRIGVTQGSIGNYESGVSNPKMELLPRLFEALNTDANFLFGEASRLQRIEFTYSETVMIENYRCLDDYGKKAVKDLLQTEYDRCTAQDATGELEESEVPMIMIKHSYYKVSAGTGFDLGDGDNWEQISIPDTPEARKASFALTIKGDSMEPVYRNGDIVLIKQQDAVDVGEIGIFILEGAGYIKKYGGDRLISLNAEYEDILLKDYDVDSYRCAGKVIGRV